MLLFPDSCSLFFTLFIFLFFEFTWVYSHTVVNSNKRNRGMTPSAHGHVTKNPGPRMDSGSPSRSGLTLPSIALSTNGADRVS